MKHNQVRGPRINHQIRVPEVRVIEDGKMLGIMPTSQAVKTAVEKGVDLIEIDPNSKPPVCKLMELGKHKYEQKKKEQAQKQHVVDTKELRIRPNTDVHDLNVRIKQAKGFLEDGDKVKITMQFQGREIMHRESAETTMKGLLADIGDIGKVDSPIKMEGKYMFVILAPNHGPKSVKK